MYLFSQHCEKCDELPAEEFLAKAQKKKKVGRKRKTTEDEWSDDSRAESMGGWIECSQCCSAFHWVSPNPSSWSLKPPSTFPSWGSAEHAPSLSSQGCLDGNLRHAFKKGDRLKDPSQRILVDGALPIDRNIQALCPFCDDSRPKSSRITSTCYICHKVKDTTLARPKAAERIVVDAAAAADSDGDIKMGKEDWEEEENDNATKEADMITKRLLFRCGTCKRAAHYQHRKLREHIAESEFSAQC